MFLLSPSSRRYDILGDGPGHPANPGGGAAEELLQAREATAAAHRLFFVQGTITATTTSSSSSDKGRSHVPAPTAFFLSHISFLSFEVVENVGEKRVGAPFPPTFFYLFLRERKIAPFPTFSFHLQGKNLLPPVVTSLHRRRRAANGLARGVRSKKALRYLLSSFFLPLCRRRRRANGRSLMWEGIRRGPKEDEPFFPFFFFLKGKCALRCPRLW